MNHTNDKPDKWKKLAQKVKEIEGNENISDGLAEQVIDFLRQLAEIELKMREEGLLKNESPETKS
jgi:hypothetical protein